MSNKVLSLIKEAEGYYQELEKNRLVRLMPFQRYSGKWFYDDFKDIVVKFIERASNVPDGFSQAPGNVPLPLW